ncbi:RICIN domain-containing protein [Kitasatospora viridis]|uniref:Uncharacterized protein n=1 Tax=Kitasatospora viridis TaxID=281105 RepID=A0A561UMZ5_9ACTN|nr:RICIN domain-containing protein [Kitasatospora viridis]TWG00717.1 hypothetical protein FHX73_114597 [Kitasatospora viridis]
MNLVKNLAVAAGLVLAASGTLVGASSPGYASTPAASPASHTEGAGPLRPATPPDSFCTGGGGGYGWFGIAPGSTSDGGVANDLWLDAANSAQATPVRLWPGNGSNAQQWCMMPSYATSGPGVGAYFVFAQYASEPDCLDVINGQGNGFASGTRVQAYPCYGNSGGGGNAANQLWDVCERDHTGTFSLKPAFANSPEWLDVWGGPGPRAFVQGNPLQIWPGNGADNQRFTAFTSPGSASSPVPSTPGC